jgi:hypothetical protein
VRVNPVLIFFTLAGAAMVVVSHLPGVTEFLDAHASAGSDPAGPVLQMIGWIWLGVSLVPLVFSLVAKRKGVDRLFRSYAQTVVDDEEDGALGTGDIRSFSAISLGGNRITTTSGLPQALEQLAKLHEMGVLNDQQFEQAKAQLLAQPQPPPA